MAGDLIYQFEDVAGLLNYTHGLSQWMYTQSDADERDRLVGLLFESTPQATPGTVAPLYLTLPAESTAWPITPGTVDGAQLVAVAPVNVKPIWWTDLALRLALEPSGVTPRRDDLVFVVQGVRADLLDVLDAIFKLEHEHAEDIQVLLAPVDPASLGSLQPNGARPSASGQYSWTTDTADAGQAVACLVKVSGLRRFYLLEKTLADPRLRLFYRHVFPPYVPVPPGLQLYVEWGYVYKLPPASFLMEAWQRDRLELVLLPAPGAGTPLVVSSAVRFRPVLQIAGDVQIVDTEGHAELKPVPGLREPKLLDVQLRLQKRPPNESRENEQALRHRIQNDLWRLQRLLARDREAKSRQLYAYADDDPGEMARLRSFIMDNPLVILNEFGYFCGRFRDRLYHLVLLPVEDGTNVVTPDRFPNPPAPERVFRREPGWAMEGEGHDLYIPRDTELFPALEPGLEGREELLRRVLGMTPDYDYLVHKVMVLLWPDGNGAIANYHLPLDAKGGFVPISQVAPTINMSILTPQRVEAVAAQVYDGLADALRPERIPEPIRDLQAQITATHQAAWETARQELDTLLAQGTDADKIAQGVHERLADIQALESQQFEDWQAFLESVLALAKKIDAQAKVRGVELDAKHDALMAELRKRVDNNQVRQLREKFEQVASAVQSFDAADHWQEIAGMLEALAAELRGGSNEGT